MDAKELERLRGVAEEYKEVQEDETMPGSQYAIVAEGYTLEFQPETILKLLDHIDSLEKTVSYERMKRLNLMEKSRDHIAELKKQGSPVGLGFLREQVNDLQNDNTHLKSQVAEQQKEIEKANKLQSIYLNNYFESSELLKGLRKEALELAEFYGDYGWNDPDYGQKAREFSEKWKVDK